MTKSHKQLLHRYLAPIGSVKEHLFRLKQQVERLLSAMHWQVNLNILIFHLSIEEETEKLVTYLHCNGDTSCWSWEESGGTNQESSTQKLERLSIQWKMPGGKGNYSARLLSVAILVINSLYSPPTLPTLILLRMNTRCVNQTSTHS